MVRRVLHVYPSAFGAEPRCWKEAFSLAGSGLVDEIHLVGVEAPPRPTRERIGDRISVWRVPNRISPYLRIPKTRSATALLEWYARIWHHYRGVELSVIHCNSIKDLPLGVALKRSRPGARLIYDPHELATETAWLAGANKQLARRTEAALIGQVDEMIVVSDSIARWYLQRYPSLGTVHVIRNVPPRTTPPQERTDLLRKGIGLDDRTPLFLYQGMLSGPRGIDLLLDVFSRLRTNKHLVFMGAGVGEAKIRERAARQPNIHFHPAVPPEQLSEYTAGADVGIHLIENTCLNHYYCLPNKVFEYLMSGLPIMVRDYPELGALVDRFGCGWKVPGEADRLAEIIDALSDQEILAAAAGARVARAQLGWQDEEVKLLAIYRKVLG
jgi:glycosyltransferase involved in cell wall biosynthesis